MNIILSSKNKSKSTSLCNGLNTLGIFDINVVNISVDSEVSSKPVNEDILKGCLNRNKNARIYALKNNINFDYLCSIEGGFEFDVNAIPYVVTYVVFEDIYGNKSTGKSLGLRLTKHMMKFLMEGHSLNRLIEIIKKSENNKENGGITSYLSNSVLSREKVDADAVVSAFVPILYCNERSVLNKKIEEEIFSFSNNKKIK